MSERILRVGVVADTHVPERTPSLPEELLTALRAEQVDHILHAGDISVPRVLEELESIAPVSAVRGNRDVTFGNGLRAVQRLEFNKVQVALLHGSGTMWEYVKDQFAYIFSGYKLERYIRLVSRDAGDAKVIVFGHTHRPANEMRDGRLYFNPGSACFPPPEGGVPSYGLLVFSPKGEVHGEIRTLGNPRPADD